MTGKREARTAAIRLRDGLGAGYRKTASFSICEKVLEVARKTDGGVFVFRSFGTEIDTSALISGLLDNGRAVYLPRMKKRGDMDIVRWDGAAPLITNSYGINEPKGPAENGAAIGLIVYPGAAFDLRGGRVGYGGGYYDRWTAAYESAHRALRLGICFDCQIFEEVEREDHDIVVDRVLTEHRDVTFL